MKPQSTRDFIMSILQDGDLTVAQCAEDMRMHRNTVDYHLRRAHSEGRAHISAWKRQVGTQGDWAAVYRFGPGEDAKEPKRTVRDAKAYSRRHYAKHSGLIRARRAAKAGTLNPYLQLMGA